ncbi:OmpH/Skp family outer membrane protein [Flavobacterium hauense]
MKKCLFTVLFALAALTATAQGARGIKIAYLDMNYILDKVPDYAEAKNQLEQKASKWRQELEVKRNEIGKLKESLQQEKALLTKELIDEREEEIAFQEKELIDYQEKRFGPTGDLMSQKAVLIKPIQDQVFTIAQDLAALRNYDFVFDKSSDLTMIVAAKKHDISDLIIKRMSRAAKQEKLSSKELKEFEKQEAKEELETNPDYAERQKLIEDRKTARDKKMEERKAIQDEKKRAYEEKREQMRLEREAKKNGTTVPSSSATPATTSDAPATSTTAKPKASTAKPEAQKPATQKPATKPATVAPAGTDKIEVKTTEEKTVDENAPVQKTAAQLAKEERDRKLEERKRIIEEKKKERDAVKKAREEKIKEQKDGTSTPATDTPKDTPATTPSN